MRPFIAQENEYNRACFASNCGGLDAALTLLEAAITRTPGYCVLAQSDPDFDLIRDDPHFQTLVSG